MTEKDFVLRSLERELPITLKVLKAMPSDKADFTPHERSQTAKRIIQTMIGEIRGMESMVQGLEHVFKPGETTSLEDAIEQYQKSFEQTLKTVKATPEADFEKPLEGMMGKFFGRRADGVIMFSNDTIHHRGQLSVYIRLAGGKVPAIYGPSADENPFQQAS